MTEEQHQNWLEFSRRMAEETHRWRTEARRNRVVEIVERLIDVHVGNWGIEAIHTWDSGSYPCDDFDRLLTDWGFDHWDERNSCTRETDFHSHVMCCVRAGFDVAVHPSAGVVGSRFTVGMIRRMFPDGLPGYVRAFVDPPEEDGLTPFDELTPDVQVWL